MSEANTVRRDVLDALGRLSETVPDWRLGQVIANLAVAARGPTPEAVWDVEDEELLAAIRRLLEKHRDRELSPVP
jgi:hypothetical protein